MEVLWKEGELPAKSIAETLGRQVGWNKNTTYTVIKKCIEKGAVARSDPHFVCRALVSKEQAQAFEVEELVNKLFDGSPDLLFASLVDNKIVPANLLENLKPPASNKGEER